MMTDEEKDNRIKELEQWQLEDLSSSLERRPQRACANAKMELQSRREKARREVRRAIEVHNKVKDALASPSRSRVHVY